MHTITRKNCCFKVPYTKVTHVIFDLDGTLLDTEGLIGDVLEYICSKYNTKFTDKLHQKTAGSVVEDIGKMLIEELKLPITEYEFTTLFNQKFTDMCSKVDFMPGAERLIMHFHENQIPIAVATSSTEEMMVLKTEAHRETFDLFHHIVCGGSDLEVKRGKPAPDIFQVCASRFDPPPQPEQCLVFEDAFSGVRGALSAGMQVVMIPAAHVPYDLWKRATLRLDSMQFMVPELFGLPPFEIFGPPVPKISFTMHFGYEDVEQEEGSEGEEEDEDGEGEEGEEGEEEGDYGEDAGDEEKHGDEGGDKKDGGPAPSMFESKVYT